MNKFAFPLIAIFGFSPLLLAQQQLAPPSAAQTALSAPGDTEQDAVVEEIVARVNNAIITRADLRRNKTQTAQDAREQNLSPNEIEEREKNALRDLIDQQLLIQKAAELGITADAELIKRLDDMRKQMKVNSLEELQKLAEGQGIIWEDFKQNLKYGILSQKVIGAEVGSHIQLTQTELQKYYDEHKSEFSQPERIRLSEILIANDPSKASAPNPSPEQVSAAQDKANDIYQQLKGGAGFEELARKLSNGPTAEQGGDLGYFKRNDLAKELESQTFSLKAGEFTKPIRTRQGFIVLLVNDHIEAGTPTFERVREQIQERLYTERIQPALREYLTKLRDDAYIDVKPGYTDTGTSQNQSHLVWATDAGPRTKQVRSKMGLGKKKTVIVGDEDSMHRNDGANSESEARSKSAEKTKKKEEKKEQATAGAQAKPAASAATGSGSSAAGQQAGPRPETKAEERARWKREDEEYKASKQHKAKDSDKVKEAKADKKDKKEKKSKESAKAASTGQSGSAKNDAQQAESKQQGQSEQAEATQQSDTTQADAAQPASQQTDSKQQADTKPEKKKKFSWF